MIKTWVVIPTSQHHGGFIQIYTQEREMQWVENGLLILQNAFPYFYLNLLKVPLVTKDSWSFSKANYPCAIGHLTENRNFKILIKIGQGLMWYILTGRYHLFGKLQSSDPNESGIWISCMSFFFIWSVDPLYVCQMRFVIGMLGTLRWSPLAEVFKMNAILAIDIFLNFTSIRRKKNPIIGYSLYFGSCVLYDLTGDGFF